MLTESTRAWPGGAVTLTARATTTPPDNWPEPYLMLNLIHVGATARCGFRRGQAVLACLLMRRASCRRELAAKHKAAASKESRSGVVVSDRFGLAATAAAALAGETRACDMRELRPHVNWMRNETCTRRVRKTGGD